MENIQDRLKRIINEKAGGKPSVFAKNTGVPHSTLYGYLKGRPPHSDFLCRICDTYKVNINWLLTGKGPQDIQYEQIDENNSNFQDVDLKLLLEIVEALVDALKDKNFSIETKKIKPLIKLLYQYYLETENEVGNLKITDFLNLID